MPEGTQLAIDVCDKGAPAFTTSGVDSLESLDVKSTMSGVGLSRDTSDEYSQLIELVCVSKATKF